MCHKICHKCDNIALMGQSESINVLVVDKKVRLAVAVCCQNACTVVAKIIRTPEVFPLNPKVKKPCQI